MLPCTPQTFLQVLVWHTRTEAPNLTNEKKLKAAGKSGTDLNVEVWQLDQRASYMLCILYYADGSYYAGVHEQLGWWDLMQIALAARVPDDV